MSDEDDKNNVIPLFKEEKHHFTKVELETITAEIAKDALRCITHGQIEDLNHESYLRGVFEGASSLAEALMSIAPGMDQLACHLNDMARDLYLGDPKDMIQKVKFLRGPEKPHEDENEDA